MEAKEVRQERREVGRGEQGRSETVNLTIPKKERPKAAETRGRKRRKTDGDIGAMEGKESTADAEACMTEEYV